MSSNPLLYQRRLPSYERVGTPYLARINRKVGSAMATFRGGWQSLPADVIIRLVTEPHVRSAKQLRYPGRTPLRADPHTISTRVYCTQRSVRYADTPCQDTENARLGTPVGQ